MQKQRKVAVFDVDGTIFRSSLFIELVERMVEKGVFNPAIRDEYTKEHDAWWNREGTYKAYIDAMVAAFYKHIVGVKYGDFADISREVVDKQQHRTYRYTRDLVKKLKEDGYYLVAISHSPKTILDYFCPGLGFDKTYGMMFNLDEHDAFTGEVMDKYLIMNKANVLHRVIEKENLTLEDSVAVGDTETDISLFEMVENPICFNPNAGLYERAKAGKWEVVVERKDVVYNIQ
jgi:phosphoserine phosphatase